jgi:hypothetical protein
MRILVLVNDSPTKEQIAYKRPFQDLKDCGLISEFKALSPALSIELGVPVADVQNEILEAFKEMLPELVLVMHPQKMAFTNRLIAQMRKIRDFKLVLWEGDPYSIFRKQPSLSQIVVARNADVVFTTGTGWFKKNFELYGAKDVRWIPSCFETDRMYPAGQIDLESNTFDNDVTAILNKSIHRFRPAHGWKVRAEFVHLSQAAFGDGLALYGKGWEGRGSKGPLPFDEQYRAVTEARVTANWDHYPKEPNYFSDRLPISLAGGSVHATTFHPGYEELFKKSSTPFLMFEKSPSALVARIESFLKSTSDDEIIALRLRAREFAYKNFRQDDWIVKMLNFDGETVSLDQARECWSN